jgi:predicted nucleic acid-binding protein
MTKTVLDACVLYSASLRDFLLRLAEDKLFDPFWSPEIQNEWTRSLHQNRPDLKRENLERTCRRMKSYFPNASVRGYEHIISTLMLPDPKDRHVLAVAIHAEAEYIVTFNLKDFPKTVLQSYGIEAISPDEFSFRLIQRMPLAVLQAAKKHRQHLTRPPKTASEYLATLEKQGLPQTVVFLREHEEDI